MTEIPRHLPSGYAFYARTPEFTPTTLPDGLRAGHSTKPGVWGLLCVSEGAVQYSLEPPRSGGVLVRAGESVVIESDVRHHVAFVEAGSFHVEFYRAGA